MQQALIFWPLHPLVLRTVAMLRLVCLYFIEDGWYGRLNLRRQGLGGIVVVTPIAIEV
jgi:hypothetical protein